MFFSREDVPHGPWDVPKPEKEEMFAYIRKAGPQPKARDERLLLAVSNLGLQASPVTAELVPCGDSGTRPGGGGRR